MTHVHRDGDIPSEVHAALELSRRIRHSLVILLSLLALNVVALVANKPAVSDEDLDDTVYSSAFAAQLEHKYSDHLRPMMAELQGTLDFPWNVIARTYSNETDASRRATALSSFLNQEGTSRLRHLLSLVERNAALKRDVLQYIEDSKSKWQTFSLPIFETRISRDEVAFYISALFCMIHIALCAKIVYLTQMRSKLDALRIIPDPSLFTASRKDLEVLPEWMQSLMWRVQCVTIVLLPFLMLCLLMWYFHTQVSWDFVNYTRLTIGGCLVLLALIVSMCTCIAQVRLGKKHGNAQLRT
ncbi:MAG: hypothetical protein KF912_00760 [Phycisphaeraceae bacterium]|nr:hypothetical protein [Phycisphaeraceae bacterium]MBX3365829.1 hypothetical protein [Phycisphaeraceae bacterium]